MAHSVGFKWHLLAGASFTCIAANGPARAQSLEDLLRRFGAPQRRVAELESTQSAARSAALAPPTRQTARAPAPSETVQTARAPQRTAAQAGSPIVAAPIAVPVTPLTPEGQRAQTRAAADEALRGDMPNSGRILGTETSVRLYGFIKTSMLGNLDMVNRGNEPSVQGVPLRGSAADQQTGDLQFSARRSRIGFDTLTPNGGTSPAMNLVPDLLGRLNYRAAFGKASLRGHMRQLRMNTNGTNAARAATCPKIRPACGEAP